MSAASTAVDLSTVLSPVLKVGALVIGGLVARWAPRAFDAVDRALGLKETAQDREALMQMVQTAAGSLETQLDQKALTLAHINVANDAVRSEVSAAIAAAPDVLQRLGITPESVAQMAVAKVDTLARAVDPTPTTAADPGGPMTTNAASTGTGPGVPATVSSVN